MPTLAPSSAVFLPDVPTELGWSKAQTLQHLVHKMYPFINDRTREALIQNTLPLTYTLYSIRSRVCHFDTNEFE